MERRWLDVLTRQSLELSLSLYTERFSMQQFWTSTIRETDKELGLKQQQNEILLMDLMAFTGFRKSPRAMWVRTNVSPSNRWKSKNIMSHPSFSGPSSFFFTGAGNHFLFLLRSTLVFFRVFSTGDWRGSWGSEGKCEVSGLYWCWLVLTNWLDG